MPLYSHSSTSVLSDTNGKEIKLERQNTNALYSIWDTKNSLYLILLTVLEAIAVILLESVLLAKFQRDAHVNIEEGLTKGIPVYLVIFIFSLVFQVALAWDAVRHKNTIQIIAFNLFNLCCFAYAVFQFKQIFEALKQRLGDNGLSWELQKLMIANPVIIGVCQLAYFYLGARLYLEFGWRIYKKIGADPDIRNMYRWYQIFLTLLKIDFFFFLGFSIQYLVLVLQRGDVEYPLTIIALPLTCVVLVLAVYAIKHESKKMITLFFIGLAAGIAYFIFKIYRIYDYSQQAKYEFVKEFLTFFACVTLVLIILTIINAAICCYNFDKGLKAHLLCDMTEPCIHSEENNHGRTLSLD
ncbi:uncharacterized protein B0P05DRAFT_494327 [Gilbertella persicaria]|uniref:uncharacterized protein n=1 Tax=Gilbertella persicaria TaxID=101096 RepID=UPI00221FE487|nr:uncharacterized protein B0P05DRAFT_494327 [Gilbertella persicaria]KAI8072177.1 hypothetical protein B0P05DRAFT_494327 [Gilbertella persicaria]